jgi:environmental stress-induced protein Ves
MLIPFASLAPVPENGGGSTTEPDRTTGAQSMIRLGITGRISGRTVFAVPAHRTLALVEGPGMVLDVDDGRRFVLGDEDAIIEFPGETAMRATLSGGPNIDFNVMTRRAVCHHKFGIRRIDGSSVFAPRGERSVLFLAEGESLSACSDDERIGLVRFDAIVFDTGTVWTLEAREATIFIVDIFFGADGQ